MDGQQESRIPPGQHADVEPPPGTETRVPLGTEAEVQEPDVPASRLYDKARRRVAELETLRNISLQLTSSLDLSTVLNSIAESAINLVEATDCLIYLYDETSEGFSFGTALGRWAAQDSVLPPRPGGLTASVIREGRPVVIHKFFWKLR